MNMLLKSLNNREGAVVLWVGILIIIGMLASAKLRKAAINLIRAFLVRAIISSVVLMCLYVLILVSCLNYMGAWDNSLIKDTILWVMGVGFVMLFNAGDVTKDSHYYRKAIKDTIKVTVAIEYLLNLFVFSLWVELICFPIVLLAVALKAYAEVYKSYSDIKKLSNAIIGAYGLAIIVFTIVSAIKQPSVWLNWGSIQAIMLPIYLTIAYIPFSYCYALYLEYDRIFSALNNVVKEARVAKYAKRAILFHFHFKLTTLDRWYRAGNIIRCNSPEEVEDTLRKQENAV